MTDTDNLAPPPKLLVVDDVADNREVLRRRFIRFGFDVTEADNGLSALALIAQGQFDLVLLDVVMPGMDGLEVLQAVRKDHSPAMLPVIMVTAKTEVQDVVKALQLGANDYITKPVEFSIALARVEAHVARRRAELGLQNRIAELTQLNRQLEAEIAERQQSQARIHHMTYRDSLTGHGNRVLLTEKLENILESKAQSVEILALYQLNIDNFRSINDALGHSAGDALLKEVGRRLDYLVEEPGVVARLGSDEFAVVAVGLSDAAAATSFAQNLLEFLSQPYQVDGQNHVLSCSIGISLAPRDGLSAERLLANASLALAAAKDMGPGSFRFFEPQMNARAQERQALESDLRRALELGQLALHYQPLYDLSEQAIVGFEALMRWKHPVRGMVSPAEFIPIAEEIGIISRLGEWALQRACRDAMAWPINTTVAVNISAMHFRTGNLVSIVRNTLREIGLDPQRLELEITESALIEDGELTAAYLHELRRMGVRVSLDDFGTGYSSLSYLRSFPFDKIKIDRSFIKDLPADAGSLAIVRAVTSIAGALGAKVTAEGVETQAQFDKLYSEGCHQIQGYLISPAAPAVQVPALLSRNQFRRLSATGS